MNLSVKVSPQGQITIPKVLLRQLGLSAGSILPIVVEEDGNIVLINEKNRIKGLSGVLKGYIKKDYLVKSQEDFDNRVNLVREANYKSKYKAKK